MNLSVSSFNQFINNLKADNFNFQPLTEQEFDDIKSYKKDTRAREIIQIKSSNYNIEYLGDLFWEWKRRQYYKQELESGR